MRDETEYFRNLCVRVQTPALLWLECGREEWRKSAGERRREAKKSREIGVLYEVGRGGVGVNYVGKCAQS